MVPLIGVLLLLALFLFLAYFDSIAQYALNSASSSLPGRLRVKEFSPTLGGVTLKGIKWDFGDGEPFFEAETIEIGIDRAALLRRDWLILVKTAKVTKPGLRVIVNRDGTVNLSQVLNFPETETPLDVSKLRTEITFEDGWIIYNDRRDTGFLYEFTGWNGDFSFPDGEHFRLDTSMLPARDKDSLLALRGEVALDRPELAINVKVEQLDLTPFGSFPGLGPGLTLLQGKVSASTLVQGEGKTWNGLIANLFLAGDAQIRDGLLVTPQLPFPLKKLEGDLELLGHQISTSGLKGLAADIPFRVEGKAELGQDGDLDARVTTPKFSLDRLKPFLEKPPDLKGLAEVDIYVSGTVSEPQLSGLLKGYSLEFQGQKIALAQTSFLTTSSFVRLTDLAAHTSAGTVKGEGWIFLGDEPRVLLALEGKNADPAVILPDFARSADFKVRVMGSLNDPVLYGNGALKDLGEWSQGIQDAQGQFVATRKNVFVLDGLAVKGQSSVRVPLAGMDLATRQMDGVVAIEGFSLSDVPGLTGMTGTVSGRALVSADLSGETPVLAAQGSLLQGTISSGGYSVSEASGDFSFDGSQVVVTSAQGTFEGSRINASGIYDLRNQAVALAAQSDSLDLTRFGLSGERAKVSGTVSGRLDGTLGVYGHASSGRGEAALSAFRRANGTLGGVAWVDAVVPDQKDSSLTATVVADGTLDRLNLDYNAQILGPSLADLGPVDIYGGATLQGQVLSLRPNLVTARSESPELVPFMTYSGAAYPFFGPLLAGPLKKVVVEESLFPTGRSLNFSGRANLASQQLDLRFQLRSAGLEEIAEKPLGLASNALSLNEILPLDVLSGYGVVQGVLNGTPSLPRLQANYSVPWLLLGNGNENRQSVSTRGQISFADRNLHIGAAVLSDTPFDPRLARPLKGLYAFASQMNGLLAAKGDVSANGGFDLRMATAGFDSAFLSLLLPESLRTYLPFGRLATDNLHLWGTAASPALAGTIRLLDGGVLLAQEAYPFKRATVTFASQGGTTRVESLTLDAPGLALRGSGTISRTGELSGELSAQNVELEQLHRLGSPFTGLAGRADVIVQADGRYPRNAGVTVGLRSRDLTWDPRSIGGVGELVPIEEFALGTFSEDGTSLESGLSVTYFEQALQLVLPEDGFRFRTQPGGTDVWAQGAVSLPRGLPDLRQFKTFADFGRYFLSYTGPDFGRNGEPFEMSASGLTFAEIGRLLGRDLGPYKASTSAKLALEGQWWRDHQRAAATTLPEYSLDLGQLSFQGTSVGNTSGFELASPTSLNYQREGEVGYLTLEEMRLGFFRDLVVPEDKEANAAEPISETPLVRQGSVEAEARIALTQVPGATPRSEFHLGGVDVPLENLSFLLPGSFSPSGMLEQFEVNMDGVLPSPKIVAKAVLTDLALGPLDGMTLKGKVTTRSDEAGGFVIQLGDQKEESVVLSFGGTDSSIHGIKAEGNTTIRWLRKGPIDPSRLQFFSENLDVSPDSPIDLAATVVDKNLDILSDVVPGEETASGTFAADLNVNGSLGYPQFEGKATLANGFFRSDRFGAFENLQLDASMERITQEEAEPTQVLEARKDGLITRFQLNTFQGTVGQKPFVAGGKAEFAGIAPTFLKMFFNGDSLPLRFPKLFTGIANIHLDLEGAREGRDEDLKLSPVVVGSLDIPSGDFHLPLSLSPADVTKDSLSSGFAIPLEYDISLNLGDGFFIHAFDAEVRAVGELRLLSNKGQPQLFGRTALSRGIVKIPFYEASFRIRQGVAYFDGPLIPRLENVEAVADLGSYRVMARVDGRYPDTLKVSLLSDPPLPQSDLSRMVVLGGLPSAFGGTGNGNSEAGSSLGTLSGQGVSFLSGALTNRITEKLGRLFSLSEISFDYIPPASYVIKLAKALDPQDKFLLTLTRVFRDNGLNENLFGIEWRFARNLLTRISFDQFQQARFWFQGNSRF